MSAQASLAAATLMQTVVCKMMKESLIGLIFFLVLVILRHTTLFRCVAGFEPV